MKRILSLLLIAQLALGTVNAVSSFSSHSSSSSSASASASARSSSFSFGPMGGRGFQQGFRFGGRNFGHGWNQYRMGQQYPAWERYDYSSSPPSYGSAREQHPEDDVQTGTQYPVQMR